MSKAKEFWVIKNEKHHTGLEWYDAFKQPQSWIRGTPKPQIHVIEKSAVDKLLNEIEKLKAELAEKDAVLEKLCAPEPDGIGGFVADEFMSCDVLEAREVLQKYRKSEG